GRSTDRSARLCAPAAGSVSCDAGYVGRGASCGPIACGPTARTRRTAGSGRERVRPGCDAANDTVRRRGAAGHDPLTGVLFAGNRRSAATTSQPGILSVPPPQTPTRRLGTIAPIPYPENEIPPPTPRAFGANDIAAYPRRNGRTPAAWMMTPGSQSCSRGGSLQSSATGSLLGSSEARDRRGLLRRHVSRAADEVAHPLRKVDDYLAALLLAFRRSGSMRWPMGSEEFSPTAPSVRRKCPPPAYRWSRSEERRVGKECR